MRLSVCVVSVLVGAVFTPVCALAEESDAQTLDAVKVTSPILSSQAQSIELQRLAVNVVSAIAADDIGQLPDQTAAAALARGRSALSRFEVRPRAGRRSRLTASM